MLSSKIQDKSPNCNIILQNLKSACQALTSQTQSSMYTTGILHNHVG